MTMPLPNLTGQLVGSRYHKGAEDQLAACYKVVMENKAAGFPSPTWLLELQREPTNQHDANAIAVLYPLTTGGYVMLGHVERERAAEWAPLLDGGTLSIRAELYLTRRLKWAVQARLEEQ
jgi:hypothetical protein